MTKFNKLLKYLDYSYTRQPEYIPNGWKVLLDAKELGINLSGFDGVAYINDQSKQVIIAYNGSNFNMVDVIGIYHDLYAWVNVYSQEIPEQFSNGAIHFIDAIKEKFTNEKISDYTFINLGHSVGGVISDLATIYMKNHGFKTESITYENPGSKSIVDKYINSLAFDIEATKEDFKVINANESTINELGEHFGEVTRVGSAYKSGSLLSKVAYTLHEIGSVLGFVYSAYSFIVKFGSNLVLSPRDEHIKAEDFGGFAEDFLLKMASEGITALSEKVYEFDKAIYMHNLANLEKIVEGYSEHHPDFVDNFSYIPEVEQNSHCYTNSTLSIDGL